jgi:uncharacterized alpha-E superfamily protein
MLEVESMLTLDHREGSAQALEPLLATTGDMEAYQARFGRVRRDKAFFFLAFDAANPNSILSCLAKARENGRAVREALSSDMVVQLNKLYWRARDLAKKPQAWKNPGDALEPFSLGCGLFTGLSHSTMSRGQAWQFLHLGRCLERADQTSRLLDVKYLLPQGSPALEELQWTALLRSASALEMYRRSFGLVRPESAAAFLIFDVEFPRSLRYCLSQAQASLDLVSQAPPLNEAQRRLGPMLASIQYGGIRELLASGMHQALDRFQASLNRVDEAIHEVFFNPRMELPPGDPALIQGSQQQ